MSLQRFSHLFPYMELDWVTLAIQIAVALPVLWFTKWYFFSYYFPGIPIQRRNHFFFGFSNAIPSKKGLYDSHLGMLERSKTLGRLFQYYHLGRHRLFMSDKYIAKYVVERVNGKGFYHRGNPALNHVNTFTIDTNSEWKKRRSAFRQSFAMIALKNFQERLRLLSEKLCASLRASAEKGEVVEIDKIFGQLTVDVICSVAFQYDINALDDSAMFNEMHDSVRMSFERMWLGLLPLGELIYLLPFKYVRDWRAAKTSVNNFCLTLFHHIKKLYAEGNLKKESVGFAILEFSKLDGVTDEDVCAEIFVMFVAGHETTAHTLSFFIYALTLHSEVQDKCHAAIDESSALSAKDTTSTMSLLPPYVEATIKESMRKYPTVAKGAIRYVQEREGLTIPLSVLNKYDPLTGDQPTPRYTQDLHLPKDTWVQAFAYILHNSPLNWGERAAEFLPERFLPTGHYTGNKVPAAAEPGYVNPLSSPAIYGGGGVGSDDLIFTPFGFGMRNCMGMNLSLMELRVCIADMLRQFSFALADEALRDERVAYESLLTSRPHKMLPVYVKLR